MFFCAAIAEDGAEHDVFGGVVEVDEFQHLGFVAHGFQEVAADVVGQEGGEAFAGDAVAREEREGGGLELGVEFVLAAGDAEDAGNAAVDGVEEGVVGGGVAGVEADDDVDGGVVVEVPDVAGLESEVLVAVFLCGSVAGGDDVFFEVESYHGDGDAADFGEVMIEYEG